MLGAAEHPSLVTSEKCSGEMCFDFLMGSCP